MNFRRNGNNPRRMEGRRCDEEIHTHKKNIYKEAISLLVAFFIQSIGYNDKPASGKQIRKPCNILGSAC